MSVIRGAGIAAPDALLVAGGHLFVADKATNAVTELALPSRKLVRVISGIASPVALSTDCEKSLYVLGSSGIVTRIALATGSVTGRASGHPFAFRRPTAIAYAAGHLFVTDSGGNSVTEITASTMKLVKVLSAGYGFSQPTGLAVLGGNVWVTNAAGQSLDVISAASGALVQAVPDVNGYLPSPGPVAAGDGNVYVASPPGGSPMITRVVPTKPAQAPWMMCNTNGPYTFSNPQALVVDGTHLWVVNEGSTAPGVPAGNSVTEMDAGSGALVTVLR
ncbi:MAG: NHL repeat-containing protein [Acidimicrobiales bacterium]